MPPPKPLTTELIAKIRAKLKKEELSISDLAKAIGKPANYDQVYAWVKGKVEPGGEIFARMQAWVSGDKKALAKSISKSRQTKTKTRK